MRLAIRALPLVVILSISAAGSAGAAVQVFLCADPDIVGDSRDAGHVGCSDAISVAQQVAVNPQPPPGGGGGGGVNCREALKPIVVAKFIDSASAPISCTSSSRGGFAPWTSWFEGPVPIQARISSGCRFSTPR